ncbi:MAG TPA: nodulation protein NfeD [Candidatus Binatia bacterium]
MRRGRRGVGARVAGLGRAVALALSVAATLVALGAALVVDTAVTAAVAAAAPTRTPVPSPTTATSSPAPAASAAAEVTPAPGAHVNQLTIDGTINPAVAEYVRDAIERSQEDGAAALLLVIDTPGGLLASTRTIVKEILGAPLPTLAYVAPSGAGAGSAGVFIVMSADVAAMAPGTNIGASTPVQGSGKEIEGAMGEKVKSFVASFAKAIATRRGRNVEWAERAVREAVSATDEEALSLHVIDFVATDVRDLLRKASGREITVGDTKRTLELADARVVPLEMRFKHRVLNLLADPNIAYLLFLAGLLGLYLELSSPGTLVPGIAGAICLLVALGAFQVLPIDTTGVALLLLGIALLVAELFLPSFGVVGAGGVIAFVLGSMLLFDPEEGVVVDRRVIGAIAGFFAIAMLLVATLVVRSQRRPPATGREALLGEIGEARSALAPRGTVMVQGEIWQAVASVPLERGARVRVTGVDGLTLRVEPVGAPAARKEGSEE